MTVDPANKALNVEVRLHYCPHQYLVYLACRGQGNRAYLQAVERRLRIGHTQSHAYSRGSACIFSGSETDSIIYVPSIYIKFFVCCHFFLKLKIMLQCGYFFFCFLLILLPNGKPTLYFFTIRQWRKLNHNGRMMCVDKILYGSGWFIYTVPFHKWTYGKVELSVRSNSRLIYFYCTIP
jgi:hypothetical protein